MKIIVSVDQNWGIGYKGNLLQRIPEDMKFFKQMTVGKVVVMGKGTFESLPGREPLKDRINIVLSKSFQDERVIICRSLDELLQEFKKYDSDDICVIGGESLFNQLLLYCSEVYVTKIRSTYPADKHFINIDEDKTWEIESESELKSYNDVQFSIVKYVRSVVSSQ